MMHMMDGNGTQASNEADGLDLYTIAVSTPKLAPGGTNTNSNGSNGSEIIGMNTANLIIGFGVGGSGDASSNARGNHANQTDPRRLVDTLQTQNSNHYTMGGISEIINQQTALNLKRSAVVTYLLNKKDSQASSRMKSMGWSRWRSFMRDLEMISVKQEVKRLAGEVENLRF